MYSVFFVNEYGQTYSSHGLLEHYKKDESNKEFDDLDRARKYAKAFVRRYPQAVAEIHNDSEIVEHHQDEEYWDWKNSHNKEWSDTNKKMAKVSSVIGFGLISIVVILLTLIVHVLGLYDVPLLYKIVITPLVAITLGQVCNKAFARYF